MGAQIHGKGRSFRHHDPSRRFGQYQKVVGLVVRVLVDNFLIWLGLLLIGVSPKIWSKSARRQHVVSPLYQLAEILRSMDSGDLETFEVGRFSVGVQQLFILSSNFTLVNITIQTSLWPMPRFCFGQCHNCHSTIYMQNCFGQCDTGPGPSIQSFTCKTADALFTRSILFNICNVGVYKWVSLLIFFLKPLFLQHISFTFNYSWCLPVSPNHLQVRLLLPCCPCIVKSWITDTGEETPGRKLVALASPPSQSTTQTSNKENHGSYRLRHFTYPLSCVFFSSATATVSWRSRAPSFGESSCSE